MMRDDPEFVDVLERLAEYPQRLRALLLSGDPGRNEDVQAQLALTEQWLGEVVEAQAALLASPALTREGFAEAFDRLDAVHRRHGGEIGRHLDAGLQRAVGVQPGLRVWLMTGEVDLQRHGRDSGVPSPGVVAEYALGNPRTPESLLVVLLQQIGSLPQGAVLGPDATLRAALGNNGGRLSPLMMRHAPGYAHVVIQEATLRRHREQPALLQGEDVEAFLELYLAHYRGEAPHPAKAAKTGNTPLYEVLMAPEGRVSAAPAVLAAWLASSGDVLPRCGEDPKLNAERVGLLIATHLPRANARDRDVLLGVAVRHREVGRFLLRHAATPDEDLADLIRAGYPKDALARYLPASRRAGVRAHLTPA